MPLVRPTFKIRCPYCRKEFHPSDALIYSSINLNTPPLYIPPKRGSLKYFVSRFQAKELSGARYTTEMARRLCPFTTCNRLLPEHDIDKTLNIAVIGDTSAGKTHYIAVLIDQLKRGMFMQAADGSASLMSLAGETERKYRNDYDIPILQGKSALIAGTPRGSFTSSGVPIISEPLVYRLTLRNNATNAVKDINLLFYDLSGEEIADPALIVQFGGHIMQADALIYLADPLTMGKVRQRLPAHLQPNLASVSSRTAHEVLLNVMHRFEQYRNISPNGSIDVPTAIVLSKSDLLRYTIAGSEQRNYLMFQKAVYDGKAHPQEFTRIHQEVEACLRSFNELALLQASSRFSNVNFFAVSATGSPPDSNGKYIRLDSLRCLDPFVWVLWKLGPIEAAQV